MPRTPICKLCGVRHWPHEEHTYVTIKAKGRLVLGGLTDGRDEEGTGARTHEEDAGGA